MQANNHLQVLRTEESCVCLSYIQPILMFVLMSNGFFALLVWGAYTWRDLFFGILWYTLKCHSHCSREKIIVDIITTITINIIKNIIVNVC